MNQLKYSQMEMLKKWASKFAKLKNAIISSIRQELSETIFFK